MTRTMAVNRASSRYTDTSDRDRLIRQLSAPEIALLGGSIPHVPEARARRIRERFSREIQRQAPSAREWVKPCQ